MRLQSPRRTGGQLVLFLLLVAPFLPALAADGKPPVNRHGLVLKYRKAGEDSFRATRRYALECFQEESGAGVYVSETGTVAVVAASLFRPGEGKEKAPLPQHGFELTVRRADGKTARFGVECYLDENTGCLVYLTETGSIGVVAARHATPTRDKPKGAVLVHGLKVKARRPGDKEAKVYGIDVFQDHNNDNLIYLTETGSIAVVPRRLVNRETTSSQDAQWQYGFRVQVRPAGAKRSAKANRYGVEVYRDANNGCLVLVTDRGSVAVVPSRLVRLPAHKPRVPVPRPGMILAVRTAQEKDFTAASRKFALAVQADESSGQLVYVAQTGAVAVAAGEKRD
jgi:hypothetical protein